MIKLITDVLANGLSKSYRQNLISNFKKVEESLNGLINDQKKLTDDVGKIKSNVDKSVDSKLTKQTKVIDEKLTAQTKELTGIINNRSAAQTKRINKIIMGTDTDSIHTVLTKMVIDGEVKGQRGEAGRNGHDGLDGESAYQVWLDAGNAGSKGDFIDSLKGDIAVSPLTSKVMDIIGDSYVANNGKSVSETWHYKIASKFNMEYNNYGVNGNGLITDKGAGTPVVDRVGTMDDSADYVIVVGGKNDYNQQLAIADFEAGLVKLIQELVERFVGKKICFFTPWSIVESETMQITLAQYSQAIEDVCAAYSIPCFNSAKHSGILAYSPAFQTKYFQTSTDRSHLNDAGHNLFVNPATKFLESL